VGAGGGGFAKQRMTPRFGALMKADVFDLDPRVVEESGNERFGLLRTSSTHDGSSMELAPAGADIVASAIKVR